jgi:fructokinase
MARSAARLGAAVAFGGGISDDAFGRRILGLLHDDNVATPLLVRPDLPTTLALAELDSAGAATYHFYVDGTSAPAVAVGDLVLGPDVRALAVGTLGLVIEPLAHASEALVAAAGDDVLVMLDPNCRPQIITDEAGYRARLQRVLQRADVVKVSGDDLAWLDPSSESLDAARDLLAGGARVVLFTDGADAVRIITQDHDVVLPVPGVEVVDTVGAGDSFGGGFLAFWESGGHTRADLVDLDLVRAVVERSIVVAGITCTRPGADPPYLSELPS